MLIWPGAFQKMKTSIFMHPPPPPPRQHVTVNSTDRVITQNSSSVMRAENNGREESFIFTLVFKVQALSSLLLKRSVRIRGTAQMPGVRTRRSLKLHPKEQKQKTAAKCFRGTIWTKLFGAENNRTSIIKTAWLSPSSVFFPDETRVIMTYLIEFSFSYKTHF